GPESERKISLFTSALPGEGKSFTSANYAVALAQQGYRVLLLDGDLRRPSLHKIFGFTGKSKTNSNYAEPPGFVDCLVGNAKLESAARPLSLTVGAGTRPAGLVLNRLPTTRGYGYYYYYASPGYGKGEGSYSSSYAESQQS